MFFYLLITIPSGILKYLKHFTGNLLTEVSPRPWQYSLSVILSLALAFSRAVLSDDITIDDRIPMIAMTTNSSMNVNPFFMLVF